MDILLAAKSDWRTQKFLVHREIENLQHLVNTLDSDAVINNNLFYDYEYQFGHLIRANLLMLFCSVMESNLITVCKLIEIKLGKASYKKFAKQGANKGSTMLAAQNYIFNEIGYKIETLTDFKFLAFIYQTRNKIIHANCVCEAETDLANFLTSEVGSGEWYYDSLEEKELFRFVFGDSIILNNALNNFKSFFFKLYDYIIVKYEL